MLKLRLKKMLDEKGLTPARFSRLADIPATTVYRLINDSDYAPTIVTLRKVAEYFGITLNDLYEEVNDGESEDKENPDSE